MLKILLSTLNAKFIHSSLALRYLKSWCKEYLNNEGLEIHIEEFTINDHPEKILGEIYRNSPDILAFSCYIWNFPKILEIAGNFKKIMPETVIIMGGPEVSFDPEEVMRGSPFIDYIISGEGERSFERLLRNLIGEQQDICDIPGLTHRIGNEIITNPGFGIVQNLDEIPSPYTGDLKYFKDRIVYFETSRGCPFNCQYCLSSTLKGVRFFSMSRVKADLLTLIRAGVKQVKFVDRTFNCDRERAVEIWKFLLDNGRGINFHFEICADLLDEDMIRFLNGVPVGLFQFEIGVQSTNRRTNEIISRRMDFDRVACAVKRISSYKNIHQHLDLIAGLPEEDYNTFKKSFNNVYELKPERLQLGFLKLLKGSELRKRAGEFGYIFTENPPYEVLCNRVMKYEDILKLKMIEDLVEKYPNTHRFDITLDYIIESYFNTPFDFYESFACYWEENKLYRVSHSNEALYRILYDFCKYRGIRNPDLIKDLLKFDYMLCQCYPKIPGWFNQYPIEDFRDRCFEFLGNDRNIESYLPHYKGLSPKEIIKRVNFEIFGYDITGYEKQKRISRGITVVLFDYFDRGKIIKRADYYKINLPELNKKTR